MSANNLTSLIPPLIGNLRNLATLLLLENEPSSSILQEIGLLRSLNVLDLLANNLTSPIPPPIGNLRNLATSHLFENELSCSIPQEIRLLRSLNVLDLSTNYLTNLIPPSIGNSLGSLPFYLSLRMNFLVPFLKKLDCCDLLIFLLCQLIISLARSLFPYVT